MRRSITSIFVPILLMSATARAELVSIGSEFQVNSYTIGQQIGYGGDIAATGAGGFVAVWGGLGGQDGSSGGVFGQRFASGAVRVGSEFQINTFTVLSQGSASVDADTMGRFVVAWDSYEQDGSLYQGVFAQRFDSTGQSAGTEFQISTTTLGSQYGPSVAVAPGGDFVIAWQSYDETAGQDGHYGGIFAQRFDSGGAAIGSEFLINTYTEENQFSPDIAYASDGSFLVVWAGRGPGGLGVWGRRYDSAGLPTGPQFQIDEAPPPSGPQRNPSIEALSGGGFIVAWAHDVASAEEDIHARRIDDGGAPIGTEFLVNTFTVGRQISSSVAATFEGGFAIAWQSQNEDGSQEAVMVRLYDETGVPRGAPTRMNITTADRQNGPMIEETVPGELVAHWTSNLQDGSFAGVFGVRLVPFGDPVTGKKLLVKNPPAGPAKNKLVFLTKDPDVAAPNAVAEDPRCAPIGSGTPMAGATLRVAGLGGDFTIDLPCVGWTANASQTKYQYRDSSGATCKTVKVQDGRQIKAVCKGSQIAYALGAAQGDVRVSLTMGEDLQYCAQFGASTSADVKSDGSNGRTYKALDAGAPTICE